MLNIIMVMGMPPANHCTEGATRLRTAGDVAGNACVDEHCGVVAQGVAVVGVEVGGGSAQRPS